MSEIDDIFARLGGGRITTGDGRDRRDIPRRGKAGGSRVVEVVHVTSGRPAVGAAVARRTETGVRAQTWDGGFPTKSPPHAPSPPMQPASTKPPEQVGHVIARWEAAPDRAPSPPAAPLPVDAVQAAIKPAARSGTKRRTRHVADPFDPEDDRANCMRCGYAVEAGRERRGLMTCAACGG